MKLSSILDSLITNTSSLGIVKEQFSHKVEFGKR